jgi:signal transduction histidine kinase
MTDRRTSVRATLVRDWKEIGGLGRLGLIGLLGSLILTIILGFTITSSSRDHLLEARADLIAAEVAALPVLSADALSSAAFGAYDELVRQELLGGETERVKLWSPAGDILYSDDALLVGASFAVGPEVERALAGEVVVNTSQLDDPAHAGDRDLGSLIEFWVPVVDDGGQVVAVFEVEQSTESLDQVLRESGRFVWSSILLGVGALGLFLGALTLARVRDLDRRRRLAESLLGRLFSAQEAERRRIVGALHDDIGQPLYRILYGLEGSIARVGKGTEVGGELARLQGLVREVDTTLRSELATLSEDLPIDLGLAAAVEQLAARTEEESSLRVRVTVAEDEGLTPVQRVALYRAAQEAVVNVRKHAQAGDVVIDGGRDGGRFVLAVTDDGVGRPAPPGLGLTTTRERLEAIGGSLSFRPGPSGSTLEVSVPVGELAT